MKVLVCGGRNYDDRDRAFDELDLIHNAEPITELIEGGARGADRLAREWAIARNIPVKTFNADWKQHGKAAGPIRNAAMLSYGPDLVLAFPGGRGTADITNRAWAAGVIVTLVDE